MRRFGLSGLAVILALVIGSEASAVVTQIDVRVLSKGAKFIGTGVAGAEITIRDAETNDGLVLELPSFSVDILSPPSRWRVPAGQKQIELRANVMLMCGCPIEPGGFWDANAFEVAALIYQRDRRVGEIKLSYAGEIGQFAGVFSIPGPGPYDITVYAFDPRNSNTGLDRATIVVAEAAAAADED